MRGGPQTYAHTPSAHASLAVPGSRATLSAIHGTALPSRTCGGRRAAAVGTVVRGSCGPARPPRGASLVWLAPQPAQRLLERRITDAPV